MPKLPVSKRPSISESLAFEGEHYRELKRKQLIRLFSTYLAPLLVLIIYFIFQYGNLASESRRQHLTAVAENQANTLDLFLSERVVNLRNLMALPLFIEDHSSRAMGEYLEDLVRSSEAFVDIGFFNSVGLQVSYAGPYPSLENKDYSSEDWFQLLTSTSQDFVITDIYLGFRQRPHFTIAVQSQTLLQSSVLRATLDPQKIYEYITSLEGANEVFISLVNKEGYYQLVTPHIGTLLEGAAIVPPKTPRLGAQEIQIGGSDIFYAYSWLKMADWALILQPSSLERVYFAPPTRMLLLISVPLIALLTFMIFNRAGKLVEIQKESDQTQAQLAHASKLASVGELAAGIAHEINNPLAVINEEAGLIKDLMDPQFGKPVPRETLVPHLTTIEESVLRCRTITHKLLGFVRKSDIELRPHDLRRVVDEVIDGLLGPELAVSNVEVHRSYDADLPSLMTDENQLQQVLLNLLNNSVDALEGRPGAITIEIRKKHRRIEISVTDTGKGMTAQQLEKIFLPFYTTKEVGKGTGLGLSVSYGIVKNLGGSIEVESSPNEGSTFTIILPLHQVKR